MTKAEIFFARFNLNSNVGDGWKRKWIFAALESLVEVGAQLVDDYEPEICLCVTRAS